MLIYKQRYKPRTSRAFTKSDLTVYDSAGNTALNALTVYGKSEVVSGAIKSAGEGYAVVDLGTLNWNTYNGTFYAEISDMLMGTTYNAKRAIFCKKYTKPPTDPSGWAELPNKNMLKNNAQGLFIQDTDYTDATAFKNSLNGVILAYQLADPTQGNTIAVKTDDGTGINGTMATFATGTPLRGIPDSDIRDVMAWDGSSGEVTKNCGEVDLGTLNWIYFTDTHFFVSDSLASVISPPNNNNTPANIVTNASYSVVARNSLSDKKMCINEIGYIIIMNSDYTDATAFKAAMNGVKLIYELATPTVQSLTSSENNSIAELRTFKPQTHAQNNAGAEMTVDYTIKVPTI